MSTTRTDRVWLDALPNKTIGLTGLQSQGVTFVAGEDLGLHVQRAAERLGTPAQWRGEQEAVSAR